MKVLHVITSLGAGGAESMLARIAAAASRNGASRQVVVSLMDDGVHGDGLRALGVDVACLGARRRVASSLLVPLRLARLLRRHAPDVVMTWLYHADLAGTLAAVLSGVGTRRVIWNLRCSDLDFARYAPTTRWAVGLLARLSHLPAAVATNSHAGRVHHAALGYRPKAWAFLPNGFDLGEWRPDASDRAAVQAELGLPDGAPVVGMVARVDPMKDHATFLAAAEAVARKRADVRFVLIGRDTDSLPPAPALEGRLITLGERRDVSRLVRVLDVAVLSSISEGFPNVVGEAMASGVPCVVTNVGDAAEIVGETAPVVPARSHSMLADAILSLLDEPAEARARRSQVARARIAENYDIARIADRYHELWSAVARDTRTASRP